MNHPPRGTLPYLHARIDAHAATEAFCNGYEIGIRLFVKTGSEVSVSAVAFEEAVFPLHHHPQMLIVEQHHFHRQLLAIGASELLDIHQEAAVAVYVDYGLERMSGLSSHGGRQTEAHRSQSAARKPGPRRIEMVVLSGPHLVLAHPRCDDRLIQLLPIANELP